MVDYAGDKKASQDRGGSLSLAEIVGQAELKRALVAVGANDELNGLLVQGEKGTAKSTAVRALADLLPDQTVVADCPYGCPPDRPDQQCEDCRERADPPTTERSVPLVTLPLGATRERVVGTLSVADALDGQAEFDPGLLARANRGILYVDEVNLLDDHLVDVLLDAAASGVNRVERDGVSVTHPARFTLVGTMNPEEGELRPQLRDRFALQATVTACDDLDQRVRIVDQAIGRSDGWGSGDAAEDGEDDDAFEEQLRRARERLPDVELPAEFTREIAELCRDAGIDGHRGDIATARTAMTLAALDDRPRVIEPDVREAAELALPHRLRSRPFEETPDLDDLVDDRFDDSTGDGESESDDDGEEPADGEEATDGDADPGDDGESETPPPESDQSDGGENDERDSPSPEQGGDGESGDDEPATMDDEGETEDNDDGTPMVPGQSRADIGSGGAPDLSAPEAVEDGRANGGSRSETRPHADTDGARVRSRPAESDRHVDAAASVRAASARGASTVESRDLRQSVRRGDTSALVVFVVDASASMRPAMRAAKGTVLELLKDAYQQRDEVAFVTFAGDGADVLLPPTDSVSLAARHLKEIPTGDRTPLPAGLRTAADVLDRADPDAGVVVVVTDGRANVAAGSPVAETREAARQLSETGPHVVVVDAGEGGRSGLTETVAAETDGDHVPLSALSAERIDAAVGTARESELSLGR
ncbi:VWA domain-containing protein [Haloarcula halophila]|uniref:VWA domain-containing protein n=1 Tax=Haloarcula TaxID=2237 RepID=UPI0023E3CC20|nr:VWA domain-containing protein [Halomicroarcula sp. DFY41]